MPTTIQKVIEESLKGFDDKFPLESFATENYSGGHDEIDFNMWQCRQTKNALYRQERFKSYLRTSFSNLLDAVEAEVEGEKTIYCTSGCDCPYPLGNGSHEGPCVWKHKEYVLISDIQSIIKSAKEKIQ